MKESRLFKIVYCLLNKGHTTASQLAADLEVSIRTIYRDLDALSAAGIPLYTESGRNGGIYLMSNHVLDKALLSETEKKEILTSLQSMKAAEGINNEAVLQKLSAVFQMDLMNWLEVDFSRWGNNENDNIKFNLLKTAIIQHIAVKLTYVSSYGDEYERIIYPLCLLYKTRAWYVRAFCPDKKVFRLFKLTRMIRCEMTSEIFYDYVYCEAEESLQQCYESVTLRFVKEAAYRVYDEFDPSEIIRHTDGSLLVRAQMPSDAWLIGFLLSFGTQVEVIAPVELKAQLAKQAKLIYDHNK